MPARLRSSISSFQNSTLQKKRSSPSNNGTTTNSKLINRKSVSTALASLASRRKQHNHNNSTTSSRNLSSKATQVLEDGDWSDGDCYKAHKKNAQVLTNVVLTADSNDIAAAVVVVDSTRREDDVRAVEVKAVGPTHCDNLGDVTIANNSNPSLHSVGIVQGIINNHREHIPHKAATAAYYRVNDDPVIGATSSYDHLYPEEESKNALQHDVSFPDDESPPRVQPKTLTMAPPQLPVLSTQVPTAAAVELHQSQSSVIDLDKEVDETIRAGNEALRFIYGPNPNLYTQVFHLPSQSSSSTATSKLLLLLQASYENQLEQLTLALEHTDPNTMKEAAEQCGLKSEHWYLHPKNFCEIKLDAVSRAYDIVVMEQENGTGAIASYNGSGEYGDESASFQ